MYNMKRFHATVSEKALFANTVMSLEAFSQTLNIPRLICLYNMK